MTSAKNGDSVRVHYTGKLNDGTIFDSSTNREPMQFTIGEGNLIADFEQAVIGMNIGDKKTISINAEKAYGPYNQEMAITVDRSNVPEDIKPEIGQQLQLTTSDGRTLNVSVIEVAEKTITIDANHPLAGKDLTFDLELIEIAA
ncbi:MAG: peptidylprolyl isomerase [Chlamydiota bacterium]|nr:peptidylprolyl isomerase [Chlamydiota bacterium]